MWRIIAIVAVILPLSSCRQPDGSRNVFLITIDGLRWQEVFTGADSALVSDERFVEDPAELRKRFWAPDVVARRQMLMPFFWEVIAANGQLYGNRLDGSYVNVTNAHRFSYPGYSEILVGYADDRVDSNRKVNNPNRTVLEYINGKPGFKNKVAVFGSWDVFPFIVNAERSGIPVNAGFQAAVGRDLTREEVLLNELLEETPSPWRTVRLDAFTYHYALEYVKRNHPRLVYIAYGETDDFAHDGDYDAYLSSAHRTDGFIRDLWTWCQSSSDYRDRTTFVITTDHGRGSNDQWTSHGADVEGSDQIWIAVLGPETRSMGDVRLQGQYYQNQIAGTVAALLGVTYSNERAVGAVLKSAVELGNTDREGN